MTTTTVPLYHVECPECGCGHWLPTERAAELWLRHHPHEEYVCE